MKNVWLFPHRAEMECAQQLWKKQNDSTPIPSFECIGFGQQSIHHWLGKFQATGRLSNPSVRSIALLGIAGAMNPDLQIGDVIYQDQNRRLLHLSTTALTQPTEAHQLFQTQRLEAVVMESFWSDPKIRLQLNELEQQGTHFTEIRGISDHCEGLALSEIRRRLPQALQKVVEQAQLRLI